MHIILIIILLHYKFTKTTQNISSVFKDVSCKNFWSRIILLELNAIFPQQNLRKQVFIFIRAILPPQLALFL